jgi:membrane protease YdiL (CAAX protease family)
MEEKQGLGPIEIQLDHFFSVMACVFWILFFMGRTLGCFTNHLEDSIIRECVFNGTLNITLTVFLFLLYRFKRWPSINPLKMNPLDCLVAGVKGVVQLFPLAQMIGALWKKVLLSLQCLLEFDCVEQPIVVALRAELTREGQLWGIILSTVIIVPLFEELLFRYFFYRFWKSRISTWGATLLTASVFALLHFNLAAFVPLWIMGIFLTFLYERYGNLIPCIMVHGLFNCISILVAVF